MKKTYIFLVLLLFGFAANIMAEPQEGFERRKEGLKKVRERIEKVRIKELTKILNLDQETSHKLSSILSKYHKERAKRADNLRDCIETLREAVEEKDRDEIKEALARLEKNHKKMQEINEEEKEEIKDILTPEQEAKFILFQLGFEKRIREKIKGLREEKEGR
ncbi:MAG: hypothetical protein AB1595_07725 [bacterium]